MLISINSCLAHYLVLFYLNAFTWFWNKAIVYRTEYVLFIVFC